GYGLPRLALDWHGGVPAGAASRGPRRDAPLADVADRHVARGVGRADLCAFTPAPAQPDVSTRHRLLALVDDVDLDAPTDPNRDAASGPLTAADVDVSRAAPVQDYRGPAGLDTRSTSLAVCVGAQQQRVRQEPLP